MTKFFAMALLVGTASNAFAFNCTISELVSSLDKKTNEKTEEVRDVMGGSKSPINEDFTSHITPNVEYAAIYGYSSYTGRALETITKYTLKSDGSVLIKLLVLDQDEGSKEASPREFYSGLVAPGSEFKVLLPYRPVAHIENNAILSTRNGFVVECKNPSKPQEAVKVVDPDLAKDWRCANPKYVPVSIGSCKEKEPPLCYGECRGLDGKIVTMQVFETSRRRKEEDK